MTGPSTGCRPADSRGSMPATVRSLRNVGEGEAIYVCVGGQGGYVERDGHTADS